MTHFCNVRQFFHATFFSCHIWNSFTPFFFTTCAIPFFHDQFFSCHFWARFVTTHCAVTNCFALVSSCHLPNPIYVRSTCQIVLILCLYTFVYICIILLMCWPGADSVLPEAIFGSPGLAHLHPHCSHDFWQRSCWFVGFHFSGLQEFGTSSDIYITSSCFVYWAPWAQLESPCTDRYTVCNFPVAWTDVCRWWLCFSFASHPLTSPALFLNGLQ